MGVKCYCHNDLKLIPDVLGIFPVDHIRERPGRTFAFFPGLPDDQNTGFGHGGLPVPIGPVHGPVGRPLARIDVCPIGLDLALHGRLVIPGIEKCAPQLVIQGVRRLVPTIQVVGCGHPFDRIRQQDDSDQDGLEGQVGGMQPGSTGHRIGASAILAPPLPPPLDEIVIHASTDWAIRLSIRLRPPQFAEGLEDGLLVPFRDLRNGKAAGFRRQQEVLFVRVVFRGHYG
ncbi:MAG: hypothetical protein ABIL62_11110 [Planctomycetota bacterium]